MRAAVLRPLLVAAALCAAALPATAQQKFSFTTNWYAQAEHGGFYQALARGLYKQAGLDVTLKMGGPQVNIMQLLAAGQTDCVMGYDMQTFSAWEQGIEAVTVATTFQKDPLVLIGHPGVVDRLEDLPRARAILISPAGYTVQWPWLKAKYGLNEAQKRPYTFSIQPFIADRNVVQQGYLTSEPYAIEKEAKFKPTTFLLSDFGWPPYSQTIVCMARTVKERPQAVAAFVKATLQGYKDYLQGDPKAANALIRKDNPAMTDDRIAEGIRLLKQSGMVFGGDAKTMGVGVITDARMKATYELMVALKQLDPAKVELQRTYTTQFVKDLKILP